MAVVGLKIRVSVVRFRPWAPARLLTAAHGTPKILNFQGVPLNAQRIGDHA